MNKTFTNIKKWILASITLTVFSAVNAAVVYNDIADVTRTQTTDGAQVYLMDLNGDLTVDFSFTIFKGDTSISGGTGDGNAVGIKGENGAAVAESQTSPYSEAAAYNSGQVIDNSLTWTTSNSLLRFAGTITYPPIITTPAPFNEGNFSGNTDYYIGVRFTVGANTHYGWIRIAVSTSGDTYTIKDYAYDDTPATAINAGQTTTTSVNKQLASSTSLVNNNNLIEVKFSEKLSGEIRATNMSGAIISSVKFNGENCQLNLQGNSTGIYNLVFMTSKGEFAKKVYITQE